jgi:hypothetical protein
MCQVVLPVLLLPRLRFVLVPTKGPDRLGLLLVLPFSLVLDVTDVLKLLKDVAWGLFDGWLS